MDLSDVKARIYFYQRENLYNSMLIVSNDALKKFSGDPSLNLYHALALFLNGRLSECVRELEALAAETDVRLATTIALIYAHRAEGSSEDGLETKLRELRKGATAVDYTNAAYVLYCLGKYDKAYEHVEKALKVQPDLAEAQALKGWILLRRSDVAGLALFESCTRDSKRNLDYTVGLAEALVLNKNAAEALNVINKAIVRFPAMKITLISKLKVLFAMQDYDAALEVLNRILGTDERNYFALKTNVLILLCRDSDCSKAVEELRKFAEVLDVVEGKNAAVLMRDGQLFSRLCGRNPAVLKETTRMLEKAVYVDNANVDYLTELAYQYLLQGKVKEALKYYKTASKTDNTSFNALLGMTLCELTENGKSDQIKQQIFFLLELQESAPNPMLLFMRAKLAESADSAVRFLEEACDEQLKPIASLPYGERYLRLLDPDFLLDVVKTYLRYAPNAPETGKKNLRRPNNVISNSLSTLRAVVKACPGLEEAQYLLGRVQYLNGDHLDAMKTLTHVVTELNPGFGEAHLLIAQIHLNGNAFERAAQSLEVGLSHNFKVRESPLYHLIQGLIEKQRGNLDEAIRCLTIGLSLVDVGSKETSYKDPTIDIALADKATIYAELIDAHRDAGQMHEAAKLTETATEEFRGTAEESRIVVLNAENAAKAGDVRKAVEMLGKVNPNESYFATAKTRLADIYLTHRRDKRAFLACYQELVQFNPGPESYVLLGDAYMKILEPDKALESFNAALQMNPSDPYLTSKMGRALIDTHYYKKAVTYFKETIALTDSPELKLQLAELYMQLKEYEKSEMLIAAEIGRERDAKVDDLVSLRYRTRLHSLLADVLERSGNLKGATDALRSARDNQNRVRKIIQVEQAVVPEEEIECLVTLNMRLAEFASSLRENEKAINYYKDALAVSPNNLKILTALAKLYMQLNYLELCQQTCTTLLNIDPDNEVASVLMADISFRKVDFDMSVFHFTQLVNKQPTNWHALVRLVEVMRRTGSIDEIPQYLKQAEQHCERPSKEPGLNYCTALYQWYSGNLNAALRSFNVARQDPEWGQDAIYNMIEICLNPEDEMLGEQFVDNDDFEYRDSRSMALKTAERLLKELKQKSNGLGDDSLKCRLLSNFLLLATKEKYSIETALDDFVSIASNDAYKDHIGPILGVATAYTMLKQGQRAKTQLKRIVKNVWTFEDAEYLERCWLLLADYYVQSNKYDLALDLLRRVLQHNRASGKAYEYTGFVCEKEQRYREAAVNYEAAWRYGGRNNPAVGYKLAYNLMKCKKYAEAIDVGQQVLKGHPEYTRIKKDVPDKSVNNLRT